MWCKPTESPKAELQRRLWHASGQFYIKWRLFTDSWAGSKQIVIHIQIHVRRTNSIKKIRNVAFESIKAQLLCALKSECTVWCGLYPERRQHNGKGDNSELKRIEARHEILVKSCTSVCQFKVTFTSSQAKNAFYSGRQSWKCGLVTWGLRCRLTAK